jgi:acyl-CoA synthetase (AMP-forming)/AMP-acid ligase II
MLTHYNWYTHVTGYYDQVLLDSWGVAVQCAAFRSARDEGSPRKFRRQPQPHLVDHPAPVSRLWRFRPQPGISHRRPLVLLDRWDARKKPCGHRSAFKITEFRGVPTMYIQLLNHPEVDRYDLSSLKTCICGAAPMPLEVARLWQEKVGVHIWEGYGLSEATTVNCGNIALQRPPKYGSVGTCYQKCNTIKIFDEDDREQPRP